MCVGLIGYMFKQRGWDKSIIRLIVIFEVTLIIASALSYGEKVYWYFIAYNLGFVVFFLFERYNVGMKAFDKLGELGFTFFLGASIPIYKVDRARYYELELLCVLLYQICPCRRIVLRHYKMV